MLARVQSIPTDASQPEAMVRQACLAELRGLKPGNVSAHPLSYTPENASLSVKDFELSADAIGRPITTPAQKSVGERIQGAVIATRSVVQTNTNLGIVLLISPLIHARQHSLPGESLRESLHRTLHALTLRDARQCYQAIRLAQPGGMGSADAQDVSEVPSVSLLEAMQLAKARDAIARAYTDDYAAVFELGLPALQADGDEESEDSFSTTRCFLGLLAQQRDSLVERKWGALRAQALSDQAQKFSERARLARDPESRLMLEHELADWDKSLKLEGVNPGTTADFTVACLLTKALLGINALHKSELNH
jgi:triphosphoribosyl-dephospho-CoA synthase